MQLTRSGIIFELPNEVFTRLKNEFILVLSVYKLGTRTTKIRISQTYFILHKVN